MRRLTLGWCLVVAVLALGTPAWAHGDTASAAVMASAPAAGAWLLASALGIAAVAIARKRRAVVLGCLALLLLVAFETGLHSVHHLADALDPECVVASASAHTGGVTVEAFGVERPAETPTPVAIAASAFPALRRTASDLGRAPPTA